MEGRKVLIIGAGSHSKNNPSIKGIGTCLVERLVGERYSPILFTYCSSKDGANELVKRVTLENPSCGMDSFRFDSINYVREWPLLEDRLSEFGVPNIFVYNAGARYYKEELSEDEREETMNVNYRCPVFLIEKIGNKMVEELKKGKIIVTSSILAGRHHQFLEGYCLSKGLLNKFIQQNSHLWKEKGIELFIVSPGITRTPMIEERMEYYQHLVNEGELSRISSPEEVAGSIARICSQKS